MGTDSTERSGTIPFMAIALLKKEYWDGKIKREFRHELESFTWILVFVCLRYQDGEAQHGTLVDAWMSSNYIQCAEKKAHLWLSPTNLKKLIEEVQADFKDEWALARRLLILARDMYLSVEGQSEEDRGDSETETPDLMEAWSMFVTHLKKISRASPPVNYVEELVQELGLEELF